MFMAKFWKSLQSDYAVKTIQTQGKYRRKLENICRKPRKESVANFKLKTGHHCMADHLNWIGIRPTSVCHICKTGAYSYFP